MSTITKERLFIKKIELENIGRFYGKNNSIIFSDSPKQNITIIIGTNGRGKTTIFDAIYWCLYGAFRIHREDEDPREEDYGLVNSDVLENLKKDESETASVTLTLHDQKKQRYIITRSIIAKKNRDATGRRFEPYNNSRVPAGIDFETTLVAYMDDENGEPYLEEDSSRVDKEINKYFPKNLSDFFLFDGEDLIKFKNKQSSSQYIKTGIEKISGLEILEQIRDHSKDCGNAIEDYIGGKDPNLKPILVNKTELEDKIQKINADIQKDEDILKEKKAEYDNISLKIDQSKKGKELQSQQNEAIKLKERISKQLRENNEELKNFLFEALPPLLIRKTLINSEKTFNRLQDEGKIPSGISRAALDKILNSKPLRCVCGREFEKNETPGEPWAELNRIKKTVVDDITNQGISTGRVLISQMIDSTRIDKLSSDYENFIRKRNEMKKSILGLESQIENFAEQISKEKFDEGEDLGVRKNTLFLEIRELSSRITFNTNKREKELEKLKAVNAQYKEVQEKVGKYETEKNKIVISTAISKVATIIRQIVLDRLRIETEKYTNKFFKESVPEEESFSGITISENYDITAFDGNKLVPKLSAGQAHVLGLAYVAGSREIIHTDTFMIIDSPLHNISGKGRNNISKILTKYLPGVQLVFLVTDSEYTFGDAGEAPVRNVFKASGAVWKEYVINAYKNEDGVFSRKIEEYID